MLWSEAIALSLAAAAYVAGWILALRRLMSQERPQANAVWEKSDDHRPQAAPPSAGPHRELGGLAPAALPSGAAAPGGVSVQSTRGMPLPGDRSRPPRGPVASGRPEGSVSAGEFLTRHAGKTLLLGFGAHTVAIVTRWIASGHPPVFGTFETSLAGSWVLVALTLVGLARFEELQDVPVVSVPLALLLWVQGLGFNRKHFPLTISERSLWIDLHASAAWVALASYVLAFVLALFLLVPRGRPTELLDEHMFRFTTWGFLAQSVTMASGAYYSFLLFGEWWRWDPVESLALMAWLAFALVIHLRLFFGWRNRQAAWVTVASTVALVASYKVIPHLPAGSTYHIFDLTL